MKHANSWSTVTLKPVVSRSSTVQRLDIPRDVEDEIEDAFSAFYQGAGHDIDGIEGMSHDEFFDVMRDRAARLPVPLKAFWDLLSLAAKKRLMRRVGP